MLQINYNHRPAIIAQGASQQRLPRVWLRKDVLVRTGCVVSKLATVSFHRLVAA